jgi:cytoskeletal protein CcmA (bactofilin family)
VNENANAVNNHLDEITLLLYVERQLDRERAQEVSHHTQTCERCLTLLRALDRESRLLTRSMLEQDEPLPARIAEFQAKVKRSMQWIWGVVFGMALLGVYSLYTGYVEPSVERFEQAGFGGTNLLSLLVFQGAFWKGWQSVFSLVEFVAFASFAGFAIFFLRKYVKRGTSLAVMFASFVLLLMTAPPAPAQNVKVDVNSFNSFDKDQSLDVKKDEVLKKDLFFAGSQLRIDGTVDGDVYAITQDLDVTGHVTGDIICITRSARISGQIDGSIRCATNNIAISGTVEKNVTSMNEDLHLDSAARIGHNLMTMGQIINVDGKVGRDVFTMFETGIVSGTIGGSLKARGQSLTISSGAQIDGQAKFEGANPADVASGAKLASPLQYTKLEHKSHEDRGSVGYYIWRVIWAGAWILLGLVLISLMPTFARETVESAERYGAALGLGVLTFFGVGIAALIACITIVGLLVGVSTFFLWIVSLFSSYVVAGAVVGRWILGKANDLWPAIGRMALGVLIVVLVTGIPHIGGWIKFGVWVWGMGAIALALYRRFQPIIAPQIPSMPGGPIGTPLPPTTTVSPA